MPFVDKTFVFAADAEGLIDDGSSGSITFAWNGADGNPAGCVGFTTTTPSTDSTEIGKVPLGATTWETWGVPAGRIPSTVQCLSVDRRLATNVTLVSHDWSLFILDADGLVNTEANLVDAESLPTTTDGAFVGYGAYTPQAIIADDQISSKQVRLFIQWHAVTGAGSTNVDFRIDNITLRISYLGASTSPISMIAAIG